MEQKAVSGKLLLVYLEGVCGLSVRFSKCSEENVPFDALLRRRLQNSSSKVIASLRRHEHKLLLVLRRCRPLGGHRFVSSLLHNIHVDIGSRGLHFHRVNLKFALVFGSLRSPFFIAPVNN